MKKKFLLLITLVFAFTLISCSDDSTGSDPVIRPGKISIDKDTVSFYNLFYDIITVTSEDGQGNPEDFTATSLNEDIAYVVQQDNLVMIAGVYGAEGTTEVVFTGETAEETVTCNVTVISSDPIVYEGTDFNDVNFPGVHLVEILETEGDDITVDLTTDFNTDGTYSKLQNYYKYTARIETLGSWSYEYNSEENTTNLVIEADYTVYQKNMAGVDEILSAGQVIEVIENVFISDGKLFNQGFLRKGEQEDFLYLGSFTNNYKNTEPNAFGPGADLIASNSKYELVISLDEYNQYLLTQNYENESHKQNQETGEYDLVTDPPYTNTYSLAQVANQLSLRTFISYEDNYYWFPFASDIKTLQTK